MEPEVSDSSLKQVPDPEDFMVEFLPLTIFPHPVGYTNASTQNMADQVQAPGKGKQASGLNEFHTACLEV